MRDRDATESVSVPVVPSCPNCHEPSKGLPVHLTETYPGIQYGVARPAASSGPLAAAKTCEPSPRDAGENSHDLTHTGCDSTLPP
jgi:hypothetical protein